MKVLVIGGTGLISVGVVKQLLARGAEVTLYNRGQRADEFAGEVSRIVGDRSNAGEFERVLQGSRFDVAIDMICFTPEEAESTVRALGGRCEQLIFCSTVCTYGVEVPSSVLIDESFAQRPISTYGRHKLACERVFSEAAAAGRFALTIMRPSHTYGPGGSLIDQLEPDGVAWDRVARGLPVLCAGDGLGLWQPTHRDDCGALFALSARHGQTYGQAYNATGQDIFTWREYYRRVAEALDTRATLVYAPAGWLIARLPARFGLLAEITRFHGAYSSAMARAHMPDFRASHDFESGVRDTFADLRQRGAWRESAGDQEYQQLVDEALRAGFESEDV
jgi:nucleoside-diphosphate-sugar epimerase